MQMTVRAKGFERVQIVLGQRAAQRTVSGEQPNRTLQVCEDFSNVDVASQLAGQGRDQCCDIQIQKVFCPLIHNGVSKPRAEVCLTVSAWPCGDFRGQS